MSELKAITVINAYQLECNDIDLVYLKSEADKVIEELEESHKMEVGQLLMEIAKLKEHVKGLILDNYLKDKELRHHKYKRCLAMAKWCDEVMMSCELRCYTIYRIWANKHKWALRWKYRWLELSEKFKTNSTAQQGKG